MYRNIITLTSDRRTDTKKFIAVSESYGSKTYRKKFQHNQKKKNFEDCSNICPSDLRTDNNYINKKKSTWNMVWHVLQSFGHIKKCNPKKFSSAVLLDYLVTDKFQEHEPSLIQWTSLIDTYLLTTRTIIMIWLDKVQRTNATKGSTTLFFFQGTRLSEE